MARRGNVLREHIIDTAKSAFVEAGFDRTSMDGVALRAATSKRSVYAHFATKDALFVAVSERVHELFEGRLGRPAHYSDDPAEAVALYCGRLLQLLGWSVVVQTCRLGIAEAERLPAAAIRLHDAFFATATARLTDHLTERCGESADGAAALASRLLGATVHPALPRALFGMTELHDEAPDPARIAAEVDLDAVRRTTTALLPTTAA